MATDVLETAKAQRKVFTDELEKVTQAIQRTEQNLTMLRQQLEQLKGATFALDNLVNTWTKSQEAAPVADAAPVVDTPPAN